MGWLLSLVTGGIGSAVSGILAPVLGYFTASRNDDLSGFQAGATADSARYVAYLNASVQMAQIRASQNMWFGARLIVLAVAGGCAIHFDAVMLDSVPLFGHAVGSWSVPKLPTPYNGYEADILLSFFLITPAAPLLSAATAWLHKQ